MFLSLYLKECKQVFKSLIYYIFIVCLVSFYVVQLSDFQTLKKPVEGSNNYGTKPSANKEIIMKGTIQSLVEEYVHNEYVTYPIGFYKKVILKSKKQEKVKSILEEVTGLSDPQIREKVSEYENNLSKSINSGVVIEDDTQLNISMNIEVKSDITYKYFTKLMKSIDKTLGGGSSYNSDRLKYNSKEDITYSEAMDMYNNTLYKDKVSRAYARIFCDYMGIMLAILPVFLAVTRGLRDRKAQTNEVIFSKNISSFYIVVPRFLSTVTMILLPLIALSALQTLQSIYYASSLGVNPDYFAFFKYTGFWLIPTILVVTALGFFLTELTDSAFAIFVQGIWWFISIFMATNNIEGYVGKNLIPRFNSFGAYEIFTQKYHELLFNRIGYTITSIVIVVATIGVYERKRKGGIGQIGTVISNRKSKHKI